MAALTSRLLDLAVVIQQVPAPTFEEGERAALICRHFEVEGMADVEIDPAGNVLARLAGSGSGKALVVSAHLDTVFPPGVDLRVRREPGRIIGPGIGDNSLGLAGLFGLVWAVRERGLALPGDLWLAANVCEEGLGNLRGMKALVERFGGQPLAYIVLEGMALGQVYHRALGVLRYRVTVRTAGGHSWVDHGQPSAIHELTAIGARLAALELPSAPRTTLNVGIISGGSSVNTIAAEAMLELDLRSESGAALEALAGQVEALAGSVERDGVSVAAEVVGRRPAGEIPPGHPLTRLAEDCLRSVGIEPRLNIGSTDANLPLSLGYPAVTIGLTTGGRAHTVHEYINVAPLELGLEQAIRLVERAWELPDR